MDSSTAAAAWRRGFWPSVALRARPNIGSPRHLSSLILGVTGKVRGRGRCWRGSRRAGSGEDNEPLGPSNLAFWDGLDGKTDWPAGGDGAHPLTGLILADYLVVDVTKPYAGHGSFLEIELAARRGEAHQTCGGRALNDDVMDT